MTSEKSTAKNLKIETNFSDDVLNLLSIGVGVIGADQALYFANTQFRILLERGNVLRLRRNVVDAATDEDAQTLNVVMSTLFGSAVVTTSSLIPFMLGKKRRRGGVDCVAVRLPLNGTAAEKRAVIFAADTALQRTPNVELARRLFGLTRSEAVVVSNVLQGTPIADIATLLGESVSSTRTIFRDACEKIGVRNTRQLTRRVDMLLGSLKGSER
jgi:DNA-binding CsgD family transcriptional regulator